jgi:hypothetical protein
MRKTRDAGVRRDAGLRGMVVWLNRGGFDGNVMQVADILMLEMS